MLFGSRFEYPTCRWLLTWEMVSPPTPISCITRFGVAPAMHTTQALETQSGRRLCRSLRTLEIKERETNQVICMREDDEERSACMHICTRTGILRWPPRVRMAWTKQRCRAGVHRKRGTLVLLFCLTPPQFPSPSPTVLPMVIDLASLQLNPAETPADTARIDN
jgi:hypothetical protein